MHRGQEAEGGAAEVLGARVATAACSAVSAQPIPTPAAAKPIGINRDARPGDRESDGGHPEARRRRARTRTVAAPVDQMSGGDAASGGGQVVGGVEGEGDLGGRVGAVLGRQEVGRPEDQQRRCDVPEFEGGDGSISRPGGPG